jgi:hypothetical protein
MLHRATLLFLLPFLTPVLGVSERLGCIDMNRACIVQYGFGFLASNSGYLCDDWHCIWNGISADYPIDTPLACSYQYDARSYAWCEIWHWDWGCYKA